MTGNRAVRTWGNTRPGQPVRFGTRPTGGGTNIIVASFAANAVNLRLLAYKP